MSDDRTDGLGSHRVTSPPSLSTLILLRHGESTANASDTFGGWLDYALTDRGRREAACAAIRLRTADLLPTAVHTSVLARAIDTADLVLAALPTSAAPQTSWRLNERHYGRLQGRPREDARREFGDAPVARWRRSYDAVPPPLDHSDAAHPANDPRYAALPPQELPGSESLADVRHRLLPYWQDSICADLRAGHVTLVVAHGNSLRALCMHLDNTSPEDIKGVEIPTGVPLVYELDAELSPLKPGGVYLDRGPAT